MIWKTSELSEISEIGDGAHASLKRIELGIPYLTAKNITKSGVDYSHIDYISEETYNIYFKEESKALTQPRKDDILYSIIGSIGGVYLVKDEKIGISSSVAIFRANSQKVIPQYLAYFLKSRIFDAQIHAIKGGVAQGFMSLEKLNTVNISYPDDVNYQKRIADILYTYDSFIENNQKQIKLLEDAARRLYKEWFLYMKFPGYEDCKIVDGIPDGWKKIPLKDIIEYEIGGGWGEENITEQYEYPAYVIRGTDFYGVTHGKIKSVPYRAHKKSNLLARTIVDGDIIFEVSGGSKTEGVAKTVLIRQCLLDHYDAPVMCASFCKLVRAKCIEYSQILFDTFQYLRRSGKTAEFDKKSASSIVNYRWKDFLMQQEILVPSRDILVSYNSISENIYLSILNCSMMIEKAEQTRDYLIPKLMSGEIRI